MVFVSWFSWRWASTNPEESMADVNCFGLNMSNFFGLNMSTYLCFKDSRWFTQHHSRSWFQAFLIFTPTWANDPIWLYNVFGMGWNHRLAMVQWKLTLKWSETNVGDIPCFNWTMMVAGRVVDGWIFTPCIHWGWNDPMRLRWMCVQTDSSKNPIWYASETASFCRIRGFINYTPEI